MPKYYLGLDIGSVSLGLVLMDDQKQILKQVYLVHKGNIQQCLIDELSGIEFEAVRQFAFNQRAADFFNGGMAVNEQIALIEGAKHQVKEIRSLLSIGGETFGLILFDENNRYQKYISNSSCAAGTGGFLDQQSERLGLANSAELSRIAAQFQGIPPKIATRCAVFAKTDLIHCQQQGVTLEAICAGLCKGLAQNILDTLLKGARIRGPVVAVGGVSKNYKVMEYLSEGLGLTIRIPDDSQLTGALGCAIMALNRSALAQDHKELDGTKIFRNNAHKRHYFYPPLILQKSEVPDFKDHTAYNDEEVEIDLYSAPAAKQSTAVFLGIDIGSTSTKAVLMSADNTENKVLLGLYTRTKGQPIQATQKLLKILHKIQNEYDTIFEIRAAGTTGSGRKFIKNVINADLAVDEITAHARAAHSLNEQIDTIIEIGGQDSKFTVLNHGQVTFSVMNYVCAAGTGSFIEEQALRLNISLDQFSDLAFGVPAPLTSDRCTVFMERDLNHFLSQGYSKSELLAAALHSVRDNYLSKVAYQNKIGQVICFQGATAKNKALVAAFEQKLQKPIHVSRYCHLTGALGVCILLREQRIYQSKLRGLDFYKERPEVFEEICEDCKNHCKLTKVKVGKEIITWGYLCGRDDKAPSARSINKSGFDLLSNRRRIFRFTAKPSLNVHSRPIPAHKSLMDDLREFNLDRSIGRLKENLGINLLSFRHSWFTLNEQKTEKGKQKKAITIGLPNALYMNEYIPFWKLFFTKLGYAVTISTQEDDILESGKKIAGAEFCAPMSNWHGHVNALATQVDYIFVPQMFEGGKIRDSKFYCYYSNYAVTLICNNEAIAVSHKIISPIIDFSKAAIDNIQKIYDSLPQELKLIQTPTEIRAAFSETLEWFRERKDQLIETFNIIIQNLKDVSVAFLGRPYVVMDEILHKGIPKKFNELGVATFFQDMLPDLSPRDDSPAGEYRRWNHWYYGEIILQAAEYIGKTNGLYPVFITAFKCSPDAFVLEYFKEIMEVYQKPYLILQIDEHGSAVGYETRIESAVRTFRNDFKLPKYRQKKFLHKKFILQPQRQGIMLIPNYDSLSCSFICAAFEKAGYQAILLEETPTTIMESIKLNDGQCLPISAIVQSLLYTIRKYQINPAKTAVFLNALIRLSCNFPQYPMMVKQLIEKQPGELRKIQVYATDFDLRNLPFEVIYDVYCCYLLGGFLRKLGCKIRPYEIIPGQTNQLIEKARRALFCCIANGDSKEEIFRLIVNDFSEIPVNHLPGKKAQVGIIGDLYVRDNEAFNQNLIETLEENGAEVITTPFTYLVRLIVSKVNQFYWLEKRYMQLIRLKLLIEVLTAFERRFFQIGNEIFKEEFPTYDETLLQCLNKYNISLHHGGETAQNVIKVFSLLQHYPNLKLIIHVNPIFCCPAMVSECLFKKLERDIQLPIVSITYDGTSTDKNQILAPYLHYIFQRIKIE